MANYEVKLVPVSDHNADGRYTIIDFAEPPDFGQIVGLEYVVQFKPEQSFCQHGGYSTPELRVGY